MERWEYLTLLEGGDKLERKLADLGEAGWELVGFQAAKFNGGDWVKAYEASQYGSWTVALYRVIFKRRKP